MTVKPIHISDINEKLDSKELFNVIDGYDNVTSETVSKSYMSTVFNSSLYNPKKRNDEYTFYYNDKEYKSEQYAQRKNNAPIFVDEDVEYNIRTAKLVNSMDVWNHEFVVDNNIEQNVFGGELNAIGNGYTVLDSSIDIGQYEKDGMYSLEETKTLNEESFFDAPLIQDAKQVNGST